jgi:hypothetical protein
MLGVGMSLLWLNTGLRLLSRLLGVEDRAVARFLRVWMLIVCKDIVLRSWLVFGVMSRTLRERGGSGFIVGRVALLIILLDLLGGLGRLAKIGECLWDGVLTLNLALVALSLY